MNEARQIFVNAVPKTIEVLEQALENAVPQERRRAARTLLKYRDQIAPNERRDRLVAKAKQVLGES